MSRVCATKATLATSVNANNSHASQLTRRSVRATRRRPRLPGAPARSPLVEAGEGFARCIVVVAMIQLHRMIEKRAFAHPVALARATKRQIGVGRRQHIFVAGGN